MPVSKVDVDVRETTLPNVLADRSRPPDDEALSIGFKLLHA
jgi:hypothetical protein